MKRIFISHPLYSEGDVAENMCDVDLICRGLAAEGHLPISPLHMFGFLDTETPSQRAEILRVCRMLVSMCHELHSYGDKGGCAAEKKWAEERGIPVTEKRRSR